MIVRRLDELPEEARVRGETWTSRRLLLADDKMNFSLHDTVMDAGSRTPMWYRNHLEAVYCIEGEGAVIDQGSGQRHPIVPGTVYALDDHDVHILEAHTELRVVCVFSPPLVGEETHGEDGAYPLLRPESEHDPYHSRDQPEWEAAPRVDPVLHTTEEPREGPLSEEQLQSFARDGFLVLEGLLSESEARACLQASERLCGSRAGTPEIIAEPGSDVVRSVFRVHEGEPELEQLARDARLAGAAEQILGSQTYIHQSRVNFKPALDGKEFFWHSDFETWHVEDGMPRMRAVSASIFLTPSTGFNGPLMLIPGSHRTYVRCVGETPEEHYKQSLRRQEYGVPSADALRQLIEARGVRTPTGPPGSVVLFDCNTMHGSTGNLSPWPRTNLFYVYNSVHNRLRAPYSGQPPRPTHIGTREVKPIEIAPRSQLSAAR